MAQKLAWRTVEKKVTDLVPNISNPRVMSSKQMEDLKRSIKKFDLAEIPVIDLDNRVIAGHQRLLAFKLLGRENETIPVRVPSRKLTKKEYDQYLLGSNRIHGDWDWQKLAENFDIDTLLVSGFDDTDLAHLFDDLEVEDDDWDDERELRKIKKPKSKVGELYQLGTHRLIVGDSTDPVVIKRLCGTEHPSMIYSDPVYNLSINYDRGVGGKAAYGGKVNDHRTKAEYRTFLKKSMEAALAVATSDAHAFYWNDQSQIGLVQGLFEELGLVNRRVCLWIKNGQNPTPGVAFSKAYEPCIYATRGRPYLSKAIQNLNEVLNKDFGTGNRLADDVLDALDIWIAKRLPGSEYQHATSKPPTLHERPMRRCTRPGDIILDSFSGSASTLVAAHQLKRRAFLAELEPAFADLAIIRFERLSHEKAKLIK